MTEMKAATRECDLCRHWNGIMNPKCEAGVAYRDLVGDLDARSVYRRLPCIWLSGNDERLDGRRATCEKFEPDQSQEER